MFILNQSHNHGVTKGILGSKEKKGDSANAAPANLEGVRKGSKTHVVNTRLDGYITNM